MEFKFGSFKTFEFNWKFFFRNESDMAITLRKHAA